MKKLLILLLSATLLLSAIMLPISAKTAEDNSVQPLWDNTAIISADIVFIDGVGYAEAAVIGHMGSTMAKIDVYVYRQSGDDWIYEGEAHNSRESNSVDISCAFSITDGAYYKADYTFTVTRNGTDEVITRTVYKTYSA